MFDTIGGLPLHPLIVHATVMFIMATAVGVIALAVRPTWRHKYGWLLVICAWLSVFSTWIAVESGNILTEYPGLGETVHAEGGTLLLILLVPYAIFVTLMILMDRQWHWRVNKHGGVWRANTKQPFILTFVCLFTVAMTLTIMGQTAIVGHSGATASWDDVDLDKFIERNDSAPELFKDNKITISVPR
jgi:hypothetical protein